MKRRGEMIRSIRKFASSTDIVIPTEREERALTWGPKTKCSEGVGNVRASSRGPRHPSVFSRVGVGVATEESAPPKAPEDAGRATPTGY